MTSPYVDSEPAEKRSAHQAVDGYVKRIAAETEAVFGDRVVGVWLIGSLAYGGFGPSSDVDIQAAVRDPTGSDIASLVERIRHPDLPCPAAGLEFVLYDVEELQSSVPPLQWLLNLNGGPAREEKISTDPTSESWHWFLLDLAIGRQPPRRSPVGTSATSPDQSAERTNWLQLPNPCDGIPVTTRGAQTKPPMRPVVSASSRPGSGVQNRTLSGGLLRWAIQHLT